MSKVIFTQSNGTISVMTPILTEINPATGVEFTIQEIIEKDLIPTGITTYSIVDDSIIPTDRSFRSAWVGNGVGISTATVVEDMTKAREIHKSNIRLARVEKFKELDVEYQRATETSADTSAIIAKKQVLRDSPAASGIATAANTVELKAQWDTTNLGTSPYS
tara:strand:+ start:948 stop:1436 length:489 start_codon:yes stop_codon:yes gene_type:complete